MSYRIRDAAIAAHGQWRQWCIDNAITPVPPTWWDFTLTPGDGWQAEPEMTMGRIQMYVSLPEANAEFVHRSMYRKLEHEGWTYGPTLDWGTRKSPLARPFAEMPPEYRQRAIIEHAAAAASVAGGTTT